jgi:hypothetical protein
MALTPLVNPLTSPGVLRWVVVPSPNRPYSLFPQHFAPPTLVNAQV